MERIDTSAECLARLLGAASAARRHRLGIDDAFIFLAFGHLGLSRSRGGWAIKPVACAEVGQFLGMPKETVRRKAMRLAVLGLVAKGPKGVIVAKVDDWLDLVAAITPGSRG
jgi:hypothetical protein